MSDDRTLFQLYVELLRKSGQPDYYYNHFPWQARIVAKNIVDFAVDNRQPLSIFSSDFELYDESVHKRIHDLVALSVPVHLVLAEYPRARSLEVARELSRERGIRVSYLPAYDDRFNHLWLAGTAYRFESPHRKTESAITDYSPEFPAQFAFHNDERAGKVREYWDSLMTNVGVRDLQD